MKKMLLPFLGILLLAGCEKEAATPTDGATDTAVEFRRSNAKIDVCHYDAENDIWEVINISENAWPAHEGHGDIQLIDEDGDGWVTSANECGMPVDCDDTDDQLTDNCCNGAEIDSNGPLFVAPADEPGLYNWQEAIDACAAKGLADGCGWYLPSKEELNAVHGARDEIGGFTTGVYLSSTEYNGTNPNYDDTYSWTQHFLTIYEGNQVVVLKSVPGPCRCVRR